MRAQEAELDGLERTNSEVSVRVHAKLSEEKINYAIAGAVWTQLCADRPKHTITLEIARLLSWKLVTRYGIEKACAARLSYAMWLSTDLAARDEKEGVA